MKTMAGNQSGAAHLMLILVAVVITAVGFTGWKLFKHKEAEKSPAVATSSAGTQTKAAQNTITKISVAEAGTLALPNGYADATVLPISGGYRMYVNRQSGGPNGILIFRSTDGKTWEKEKDIIIPGAATNRAIATADGVRIYYPDSQPMQPTTNLSNMNSSFSTDGLTFTKEPNAAVKSRSSDYYIEGPTVFQLADKTWRMYFNENTVAARMQRDGEIWGASSKDGLTWTRDDKVTLQAGDEVAPNGRPGPWKQVLHPFVLKHPKGGYIMFYNSHSELYAATSTDGLSWKKIGHIGIHGADIDGYFQADGTIRVYYGDFSPQTGGLIYAAALRVK